MFFNEVIQQLIFTKKGVFLHSISYYHISIAEVFFILIFEILLRMKKSTDLHFTTNLLLYNHSSLN